MPTKKNGAPSRLRRMRTDRGWTLADVVTRSGFGRSTISGAERRSRGMGPRLVAALARVYGVTERTIREAAAN